MEIIPYQEELRPALPTVRCLFQSAFMKTVFGQEWLNYIWDRF